MDPSKKEDGSDKNLLRPQRTLRLYAILNTDLHMASGKAIAQAGHAYTDVLLDGLSQGYTPSHDYARLRPGTKVTLGASEWRLQMLVEQAEQRGIPVVRIIDSGHIHPPHFDGSPVFTAVGLGPVCEETMFPLLKKLPLWQDTSNRQYKGDTP